MPLLTDHALDSLDNIATYELGWDSYSAPSFPCDLIDITRSIIISLNDNPDLESVEVGPSSDGSIDIYFTIDGFDYTIAVYQYDIR